MPFGCIGSRVQLGCLAHRPEKRLKPVRSSVSHSGWGTCRSAYHCKHCQLRQRGFTCQAASSFAAPAPGAPVPGDHHGALIHQLLHDHSDEAETYVKEGLQEALDEAQNGKSRPAALSPQNLNGSTNEQQSSPGAPEPEDPKQFIPHRWRIVGMMSLAFILCNMDKVCLADLMDVDLSSAFVQ